MFFALEIPYYKDDYPVIIGSEFEADNKLCSYVFDGMKLEQFKTPYNNFLTAKNYRFSVHNG